MIYAAGAYLPVAVTKAATPFGGANEALTSHSDFALGVLWNRGARHALGIGFGAGWGIRTGERGFERNQLHATYRRWLRNGIAVDVSPGIVRGDVRAPAARDASDRRTGTTATVDLHYKHWAIATVRGDFMSGKDPGAEAFYVGFKLDGYTAVLASALAGVAYVAAAFESN